MEFQTRSESNGIGYHSSLNQAFEHAKSDKTVWKISFSISTGERIRLVRYADDDKWVYIK